MLPLSTKYIYGLMPWLAGIGFQLFFDYTLKALGHPRFAMMVMIGTILLNIALSVTFVLYFGLGTFGTGIILGISNGMIPIISYNWGARYMSRVKGTVRMALTSVLVCGGIMIFLLWTCGRAAIELFINPVERQVIGLAVRGAGFMSLTFLFNGFNIFAAGFLTAVDKPGLSLVVASLRGPVMLVAGILSLPLWFGVDGIWLSMPLADAFTAIVVLYLFVREKNGVHHIISNRSKGTISKY